MNGASKSGPRCGPVRAIVAAGLILGACSSGPLALGRLDESAAAAADSGVVDGAPDAVRSPDANAACEAPTARRHYAFDGVGTDVVDRAGGPNGHLRGGASLDGSGLAHLDGIDDYVDLPNTLLAGSSEVSIAVWIRQLGGPSAYRRVFDFGSTGDGPDPPLDASTAGRSYFAVATATGNVPPGLAVLLSASGPGGEIVALSDVRLDKELRFVVVVASNDALSLFYEGALVSRVPRSVALASVLVDNAWLGRSQYSADGFLEADYADVRLYDRALTDCEVQKLFAEGVDPP
jgi:hypothetical protein